jgi:hypothetical protein
MAKSGNFRMYNIKFFGSKQDAYGMPEPFHNYLVTVAPWNAPGAPAESRIGSVASMSDAPMPEPRHFIGQDGPESALMNAYAALTQLPDNRDLQSAHHEL